MTQESDRSEINCHSGAGRDGIEPGGDPDDGLSMFYLSTVTAHRDRAQSGSAANRKRMRREIKELMYRRAYDFVRALHMGKRREVGVP